MIYEEMNFNFAIRLYQLVSADSHQFFHYILRKTHIITVAANFVLVKSAATVIIYAICLITFFQFVKFCFITQKIIYVSKGVFCIDV